MTRWLIGSGPLGVRFPGGEPTRPVSDFVAAVACALTEQGDDVRLLFTGRSPNEHEVTWLDARGVSWRYWGDGRPATWRHARMLHRTLADFRPDAVMFEFGGVSLGLPLAFAHRVPLRIARYLTALDAMRHDQQVISRINIWRRRLVYRTASYVAINAPALLEEVVETFGVPRERVIVQLQGVHAPAIELAPVTARVRELVCVGRLAHTKGQHVLISALGELRAAGVTAVAHFIGGGDQEPYRRLAAECGVTEQCMFHGEQPRAAVYATLARHAIAVQPSLADALPQSAQEAVVCGAVVIASHVGGIPAIVRDDVSGLLVPAGDSRALARACSALLRDDALLARLGAGATTEARAIAMSARAPLEAARLRRLAREQPSPSLLEVPR